jgi:hypothetical protein
LNFLTLKIKIGKIFHVKTGKYGAAQTMEVKKFLYTLAPLADGEQDKTREIKGT